MEPLSPARYRVQFTASEELHAKLERLAALMRSEIPDGDIATIIERAVTEKLERLEARRFGSTAAPRSAPSDTDISRKSRHIPYGMGGDHSPENVSLLCPQHNRYLAVIDYGQVAMRRHRKEQAVSAWRPATT